MKNAISTTTSATLAMMAIIGLPLAAWTAACLALAK
jgi:hypothetical protein